MSGAANAGPIADAAVSDLRALERVLERDLLRLLLSLDTETGADSLVRRQGQTQSAVLRQVTQRLEEEGQRIQAVVGLRAVQAVEAVLGKAPATMSVDVRTELDAIVNGQVADVVAVFKGSVPQMRQAVALGIASGGSLADVVDQVRGIMEITHQRAASAVDSAIMAAGRRTVLSAADDSGLDLVYVYVGPKDVKNRPFCAFWVGKACTEPALCDNEQGLPADDYAGGYNCRHSWAPTLPEEAIADGIKIYRPDRKQVG
jgi:hypothetical protein